MASGPFIVKDRASNVSIEHEYEPGDLATAKHPIFRDKPEYLLIVKPSDLYSNCITCYSFARNKLLDFHIHNIERKVS